MKKLLILAAMAAALTAGCITVSAAPARNGPGFCRAAFTACEAAAEEALLCAEPLRPDSERRLRRMSERPLPERRRARA